MKIETIEVAGFRPAYHGMRNPMDSWAKSDSTWHTTEEDYPDEPFHTTIDFLLGDNDKDLSSRLQNAGPEHYKHLRMIMVWADITAPRYWWTEFDTYRAGVEKISCSTMHKLTSRQLTMDDFELDVTSSFVFDGTVNYLNCLIDEYKSTEDQAIKYLAWRKLIQNLPQSFLQKRTVMMSYAALKTMYKQRENHKLAEWHNFRGWIESLPESWMITE